MSRRCFGCMEMFDDSYDVCPYCGYQSGSQAEEAVHMDPGTILHDRYVVGRVLGYGGFGVTYIGWDGKLEQKVAIKEYLPNEFSTRMPGQVTVSVFNGDKSEQFRAGLTKFVDEAKRLAKFQNEPGIVKIFDSFSENGTAYIIMEYLEGETLASYLRRAGTIPEDLAVDMLHSIMESLQVVHAQGLLHRDIAPDNIFLTTSGEVKLIDFGASRYATTSHSRSLTVIIKPGYSPEEQYRSRGDQGPYTDVYALGATMYKMITGQTPPDAMERRAKYETQNKDILVEPHKLNKNISRAREVAILNAMNVRIEDRTPDVPTFMSELSADPPAKRRYGKIKKIDIYAWPLWVKILVPALFALIVAFGALLLFGVIDFSNYTSEIVIPENIVAVPDVEGFDKDEALALIEENHLLATTGGNINSEYVAAGTIILQTPAGGTYLEKNGTVVLTVSASHAVLPPENGMSTVPYVIWDEKDVALDKFRTAGLGDPEIEEVEDETVAMGQVISVSVEAGEKVPEGTVLQMKVSLGPSSFAMIEVLGMQEAQAREALESRGLMVTVEYDVNNDVPQGSVFRQSKEPGEEVRRGDTVTVIVASVEETISVPDVVGKEKAEAERILKEAGFKVMSTEGYDYDTTPGSVISQAPAAGAKQKKGATILITVCKEKEELTVTLDPNGGRTDKKEIKVVNGGEYGALPTPTRDGFTFEGWYSAKTGGSKVTEKTKVTADEAHTLYAQWKEKPSSSVPSGPVVTYVTVSLNANGGSVSQSSITAAAGGSYGNLPTPSRSGYTFAGWYTAASGGSRVTSSSTLVSSSNHTLYAQWSGASVTVILNANGGSVSTTSVNVTYGGTYGSLPTPTRSGYAFDGWYTAATGGTKVSSGSSVASASGHTLYAHWTAGKVTVTLNSNGGTSSQDSLSVTYGGTYGTLPTPTRDGYTFDGWYTAASGGSKVTSSTSVSSSSAHTLYAHWSAKSITVTFDANGGSVSQSSAAVTYGGTYGSLPTPTRTGHSFNGWYTAASGGSQVTSSSSVVSGSDHTLYAQWTANTLTVYFDGNGGSASASSMSVSYGSSLGSLPSASREGYDLDGWADSSGNSVSSSTAITEDGMTLYAQWTPQYYSVDFNANGGECAAVLYTIAYGDTYGSLPSATRSGYNFDGWYTSSSGGTQITSSSVMTYTYDHTLYAHWSIKRYTINSYANQSLSALTSVLNSYGISYTTEYGYMYNYSSGTIVSNSTGEFSVNDTVTIRVSNGPKPLAVGDVVYVNETCHSTSYGGSAGAKLSGNYYLRQIISGRNYPYAVSTQSSGATTGWVSSVSQRSGNTW